MNKNFITLHILRDIPWSNLNRDDTGTPKRTILGGVERGMLSSQSIKRAIRHDYESRILEQFPNDAVELPIRGGKVSTQGSIRTRSAHEYVTQRALSLAKEQNVQLDAKKVEKTIHAVMKSLTGGEATVVLLSIEELETMAATIVKSNGTAEAKDLFQGDNRTGALAIAAFGRMFANAQDKQTDAAIAVSPAISTHGTLIETDYFIAADDFLTKNEGAGAAHLGAALYTSGIFYHSVTIDIKELCKNWTGITGEHVEQHLAQLLQSIVRCLPTGKKNATAPYTEPLLVIAEAQGYREAYSISDPVQVEAAGGFIAPTLAAFKKQFEMMRRVSDNYGDALVYGARADEFSATDAKTEKDLLAGITKWIIAYQDSLPQLNADKDDLAEVKEAGLQE